MRGAVFELYVIALRMWRAECESYWVIEDGAVVAYCVVFTIFPVGVDVARECVDEFLVDEAAYCARA